MLAGQFGLAAIVKSRETQLPLWALMLSSQLLNILFAVLVAVGLESYNPVKGTNGGYGQITFSADYSHSLAGALVISIISGLIAMAAWGRRNGLVIAAVVFSNWILALVVHRGDLALYPGQQPGLPRLGLAMWAIPWLSIALELLLVLLGAYFYYHAAMRAAVRAERQAAKGGTPANGYRSRALLASGALLLLLVSTLVGNVLGLQ